jgi:Putative regulator of cell autolysis
MLNDRKSTRRIIFVFLMGLGIGNVTSLMFNYQSFFVWKDFLERSFYSLILTLLFWQGNKMIIVRINKNNSWLKRTNVIIAKILVSTIAYSLTVMFAFYLFTWFVLMHRQNLSGFFNNFKVGFYICLSIAVIWILAVFVNLFFRYWKNAILREEQLKRESLALQYESLKNQVNPHFLFNSLNVLTSLIEKDTTASVKYVKQLSDVFRYVLDQNTRELVPLETELKFIESYNFLQHIRFGDNFRIEIQFREKHFLIVPMALQILIENAVKHNEISTENPLVITISDDADFIVISNNIQPRSNLPESNQIGLKNLSFQYEFLSGKHIEIRNDTRTFVVKLPKIKA